METSRLCVLLAIPAKDDHGCPASGTLLAFATPVPSTSAGHKIDSVEDRVVIEIATPEEPCLLEDDMGFQVTRRSSRKAGNERLCVTARKRPVP